MTTPSQSTCVVIREGEPFVGKQGLTYRMGLTGATAGTRDICMTVLVVPPGARAKAHAHDGIETAVYVIEGRSAMVYGARLEERLEAGAGDYCYIPAGVPHVVFNPFDAPCRAVVAHTGPDDQAGIVMMPELDALLDMPR
jgi:uncharacterized RmlC-like cupin family protein